MYFGRTQRGKMAKREDYLKMMDVLENDQYKINNEEANNIFYKIVSTGIKENFFIFGKRIFVKRSEFDKYANCVGL